MWVRAIASASQKAPDSKQAPASKPVQVSDDGKGKAGFPALASAAGMTCIAYEAKKNGETVVFFRRIAR